MYDKQASKRYYENNKKNIIVKNTEYRNKNIEYVKAYSKIYYQNNKEKYNNICKNYYYNNKDYYREYYEKNKEKYNNTAKKNYKTENLNFIKDCYYYRRLPEELKELIDFEDIKKDRKDKAKDKVKDKVKTTIKTVLKKEKPLIEIIEGKKTILFE